MLNSIEKLAFLLAKLPGMGSRSAKRAVLHLLKYQDQLMLPLADELKKTAQNIKTCSICANLDEISPCQICIDAKRNHQLICIVETVSDLWAIERARIFNGTYHVLQASISSSARRMPEELNLATLNSRILTDQVTEVIIATNATLEGQTTCFYITDILNKDFPNLKITRLASGIPIGGELDYLDDSTLEAAMISRKTL